MALFYPYTIIYPRQHPILFYLMFLLNEYQVLLSGTNHNNSGKLVERLTVGFTFLTKILMK